MRKKEIIPDLHFKNLLKNHILSGDEEEEKL
jgi:hypothetical protein